MKTDVLATTKCNNVFLDDDGFCGRCGQNHLRLREKQTKARKVESPTKTREMKSAEVRRKNMGNPLYRTIYETVDMVAELYEIEDYVAIFRNRRGSSHQKKNGKHVLKFSYSQVDAFAEKGYREYKSIEYMVPRPRPTGTEAAKWLALHEAAHMIVSSKDLRRYGDQHGAAFQRYYGELIELFV